MNLSPRISRQAPPRWRWCRLLACVLAIAGLPGCGGKRSRADLPPLQQPTVTPTDAPAPSEIEKAEPGPEASPDAEGPSDLAADILETAYSQLGVPYRWGGQDPGTGFDCSGFVRWVFERHGVELPRSSRSQSLIGAAVSRDDLKPGDLLFYSRSRGSQRVGHVGIYTGEGRFIHSPRRGRPIQEDDAFDAYRSATFVSARRVVGPPPERPLHYTVQKGDYIWALARRFDVSPVQLLQVNGLKKDSILRIGQRLIIPPERK